MMLRYSIVSTAQQTSVPENNQHNKMVIQLILSTDIIKTKELRKFQKSI